jgi:hypothetical protein
MPFISQAGVATTANSTTSVTIGNDIAKRPPFRRRMGEPSFGHLGGGAATLPSMRVLTYLAGITAQKTRAALLEGPDPVRRQGSRRPDRDATPISRGAASQKPASPSQDRRGTAHQAVAKKPAATAQQQRVVCPEMIGRERRHDARSHRFFVGRHIGAGGSMRVTAIGGVASAATECLGTMPPGSRQVGVGCAPVARR